MADKFSSFERVTGGTEEEKQQILGSEKDLFEAQKIREPEQHELRKTPEELAIIDLADQATSEIRKKFGLPEFRVAPEHIVIIEEQWWDWGEGGDNARFDQENQLLETPYHGQSLAFARLMFHEILHMKSFQSLKILKNKRGQNEIHTDRVGLRARTRKGKRYFNALNEALTEELTKQFIADIVKEKNPLFIEEISSNEARGIPEEEISDQVAMGYREQREVLNILIDKIFDQNPDDFKTREEVLDVFTKSAFADNLLSIGKLIDRTFGSGTFREIGKREKNPESWRRYVEAL